MLSTFGGSSQPGGCPPRAVAGGWTKAVRPSRALGPAAPRCRHEPPPGVVPSTPTPPLYTWEPREGKSGSHTCAGPTQERAVSWLSLRGRWSVPGSGPSQSPRGAGPAVLMFSGSEAAAPPHSPLGIRVPSSRVGRSVRWKSADEAEGEWGGLPCPSPRPASLGEKGRRAPGGEPVSVGCARPALWNPLFSSKLAERC